MHILRIMHMLHILHISASEEEIKREKAVKTAVFADVNKQINYMKTDHIRGKIFKRREGESRVRNHEKYLIVRSCTISCGAKIFFVRDSCTIRARKKSCKKSTSCENRAT